MFCLMLQHFYAERLPQIHRHLPLVGDEHNESSCVVLAPGKSDGVHKQVHSQELHGQSHENT